MLIPMYIQPNPIAVKIAPRITVSRSSTQNRSKPSRRVWGETNCRRATRSMAAKYPTSRHMVIKGSTNGSMV